MCKRMSKWSALQSRGLCLPASPVREGSAWGDSGLTARVGAMLFSLEYSLLNYNVNKDWIHLCWHSSVFLPSPRASIFWPRWGRPERDQPPSLREGLVPVSLTKCLGWDNCFCRGLAKPEKQLVLFRAAAGFLFYSLSGP